MNNDFEKMMHKLSPTLQRITHKLNGRFAFFNEDDLYQEALIHLWVSFEKGSLSDKTDSYILQGCYFFLKNYIRTVMDKAVTTSLDQLMDDSDLSLRDMICDPNQDAAKTIDEKLIKEYAENNLSDRENVILSHVSDGMTVREIGIKLGISHVMVVKIRSRIKKKMMSLGSEGGYQN